MPSALILSGLDSTGGAGIVADIETFAAIGVSSLPIITTLTVQNTRNFVASNVVSIDTITSQIKCLAEDISFSVIKIGLLANKEQIMSITNIVDKYKHLPIVLDPIIKSGNNKILLDKKAINALKKLIKLCTIITPNKYELQTLTRQKTPELATKSLGSKWTLLTTTGNSKTNIEHNLYYQDKIYKVFNFKKIDAKFHGSGCTLSSAICAYIAKGYKVNIACTKALKYTYKTLEYKYKIGTAQYHPKRIKC